MQTSLWCFVTKMLSLDAWPRECPELAALTSAAAILGILAAPQAPIHLKGNGAR
jgi:hypothetical protein